MDIYNRPSPQDYLVHHGVKGMRWGVRRYQNYDGSYTQRGLERYRKADQAHEKAKQKAIETKQAYKNGTATKAQYKAAKGKVKTTKRALDKSYDKLKTDKMADEGKKLYQSGKTIRSNTTTLEISQVAVSVGAFATQQILSQSGNMKVANISAAAIATGGTILNGILAVRNNSQNKKLRAYYAH